MKSFNGMKSRLVSLSLLFALAAASSNLASGQVSSSMAGRIEDPSGAAVAGANVTITNLETGIARTVLTDEAGSYLVLSLPVGRYEVKAGKTGFKAEVQTGINLLVAQQAVVNLKLAVGAVQEQVTVTSDAPLVNTTTQSVAGLVGEKQVKDLPINGRSYDLLITLNPGTVNYSMEQGKKQGFLFSVSGKRPTENMTLLNGIEITGGGNDYIGPGSSSGQLLGVDAIREYNVVTDTYGAEYGKKGGGQISVVTQSGTNQLHGSVFEFLRNSAIDARNFFDHGPIPPFERNQFGGALGGPIRKDKTFIFGNYEGFRQRMGTSGATFVPDLNARQGLLPCGSGGFACAPGTATGTPTLAPSLDKRMLPFTDYWPLPDGPNLGGGIAIAYTSTKQTIREDYGTTRVDQSFSDKDSLSGVYTIDDGDSVSIGATQRVASLGTIRNQIASIQETHIFSPNVVNTITVGLSRSATGGGSEPLKPFPAGTSFVLGQPDGTGSFNFGSAGDQTATGITAASGLVGQNGTSIWNRTLFTYSDGLQVIKGKHQISAGVWLQRLRANEFNPQRANGQATFANLLGFLQGNATAFTINPTTSAMGWRTWLGAWYLQDSIKLRSNLTIRVGLRHEFSTGYDEVNGRAGVYSFVNGVIQAIPKLSNRFTTENNSKWLLGPRIGLAWDVFGNGKTSIHAAGGIYYDMVDHLSYLVDVTPPLSGQVSYSNASLFSIIPVNTSSVPPPCDVGVPNPCNIYIAKSTQPNYKVPTVQSWNFSMEQQLTRNTGIRLAYVGYQGYHQWINLDPNTVPSQFCSNAAGCASGGINKAKGTVLQGTEYIPVVATRPNPYVSYSIFLWSEGNSNYNALQMEFVKRPTSGLQFRANYTWSKALDLSSGVISSITRNQGQTIMNPNNLHLDWGLAAHNITHQASGNFNYELPIGHGKALLGTVRGVADKLISGWQLNGIVTLLSGFPFTPKVGTNIIGNGDQNGSDRPSWNPAFKGPVTLGSPDRWFDPNAFMIPTSGTFGNVGKSVLFGPSTAVVDLSLFKTTRISERISLQFRAEAFNFVNHANFAIPNVSIFTGNTISPTAGVVASTQTSSRQMQFGLKLVF